MIGSRNAAVLPVPVSAQPMMSSPLMTIGMTALWIGVVLENPRMRMPSMSEGSSPERVEGDRPRIVGRLGPRDLACRGRHVEVPGRRAMRRNEDLRAFVLHAALDVMLYGNSKS